MVGWDRPKGRHRAPVRPNHTGQTLKAAAGATLKDLMKRLGHSSPAAATRYLHAVDGRDAEIVSALSELAASGSAARLPRSITMRNNGA